MLVLFCSIMIVEVIKQINAAVKMVEKAAG